MVKLGNLKLTVIGGGSSYTPELMEGIINNQDVLKVSEVWLADVEEGKEKLSIIADLSRRMVKKKKCSIKIFETFDRKEAIKDADYIITQIRVGQLAMRRNDECISIKDRKSTRLNSSHVSISYAVFCLKKKTSNG